MRRFLALVMVAATLAVVVPPADAGPHPRRIVLDGVHVHLDPGTRQVVTVRHTSGWHARVTFWRLGRDGWDVVRRTSDGRTGYGGLVAGERRHQGTGTTPLGTERLLWAFGTHPRAARSLGYRQIRPGDFWVEDNTSRYYNRYRNQRRGGFHWRLPTSAENGSERLTDYPKQYEFSIVTGYNREQVRHRGAGIFLHVNGSGATAGCVSAPRPFLAMLMRRLDPARAPVIAVGR